MLSPKWDYVIPLQDQGTLLKKSWVILSFILDLWLVITTHIAYEKKMRNFKTQTEHKCQRKAHSDLACRLLGMMCLWLAHNFSNYHYLPQDMHKTVPTIILPWGVHT